MCMSCVTSIHFYRRIRTRRIAEAEHSRQSALRSGMAQIESRVGLYRSRALSDLQKRVADERRRAVGAVESR